MRTLFIISIYNYAREVLPVIEYFASRGASISAVVGWYGPTADDTVAKLRKLGIEVVFPPADFMYGVSTASVGNSRDTPPAPSIKGAVERRGIAHTLRRIAGGVPIWRAQRRLRVWAKSLFDTRQPDLVLQGPYHSCGSFDQAIAAERSKRRTPSGCYPVSAYHGRNGAILARFSNLGHGMITLPIAVEFDALNRVLAQLFPAWTAQRGDSRIFMFDPVELLVARLTGLLSPNDIWQKPAEGFDRVFVFSKFSADLLRDSAYPMAGVRIAGIPLLDRVVEDARMPDARKRLFDDIGLPEGAPFILFNVEPSAEHHYRDWDTHWRNFRDLMRETTSHGLPVVLSLHPLCNPEDYRFAEREFGVRLSLTRKIYDLYPYCKMSVSFPCSTNVVAELFRKPLIIYDFFRLAAPESERVAEFRLPGAVVAYDVETVGQSIQDVLSKPASAAADQFVNRASQTIYNELADLVLDRAKQATRSH